MNSLRMSKSIDLKLFLIGLIHSSVNFQILAEKLVQYWQKLMMNKKAHSPHMTLIYTRLIIRVGHWFHIEQNLGNQY